MPQTGTGQPHVMETAAATDAAMQQTRQTTTLSAAVVGRSAPLGALVGSGGVNFSLYSRGASRVDLLFFDRQDSVDPCRVIALDGEINRTYHYWHCFIPGVRPGQIYGYRIDGPFDPEKGMRFDAAKVLLDPYGRGVVVPMAYSRKAAQGKGDTAATAMRSVVVDSSLYDWEGDAPLRLPSSQSIIYEMHVKGFTRHPSSGVSEEIRSRPKKTLRTASRAA